MYPKNSLEALSIKILEKELTNIRNSRECLEEKHMELNLYETAVMKVLERKKEVLKCQNTALK